MVERSRTSFELAQRFDKSARAGDRQDRCDKRITVCGGCTAIPLEQRRAAKIIDHVAGGFCRKRAQPDSRITEQFGLGAAHPQYGQRTKRWARHQSEQYLGARLGHFFQIELRAFDAMPRDRFQHRCAGSIDILTRDAHLDGTQFALVNNAWSPGFQHEGRLQIAGRSARALLGNQCACRRRNAYCPQKLLHERLGHADLAGFFQGEGMLAQTCNHIAKGIAHAVIS